MFTLDDITAKTNAHIVPKIVDAKFKAGPLLARLRNKPHQIDFEGGTMVKQPIMYAELNTQEIARGGTVDVSYVQTDQALQVLMKYMVTPVTLYGTDNVLSRGPEAAMLNVESKVVNAAASMAKKIDERLYLDGQGTNSPVTAIDGLDAAVDDGVTFTTYGQLTRADISATQNEGINSYVATVPALSLPAVNTAFGATWFGAEHADMIICTQAIWNILWNKIQPQQRFQERESDVGRIGFQSMLFNGVTLTVDQYAPAGKLWFLNTDYIQLWISKHPQWQFQLTGWVAAQNTVDLVGKYQVSLNLLVTNPRLFGKIIGITS